MQLFHYKIKFIKNKKKYNIAIKYHLLVYNTSNQVCHNSILIIHFQGFVQLC